MNYLKNLFRTGKKWIFSSTILNTSRKKISNMLVSSGDLRIERNSLYISNYPFKPSIAYHKTKFSKHIIDDIDVESYPPTIRVKNEIIFLSSNKREELKEFAIKNKLKIVRRPNIWEWILEPFLDTEYTIETDERLIELLKEYGLNKDYISSLRKEVKTQMLKYNFDTMLWEWGALGAEDVLKAMRTKYNERDFKKFYDKVMKIALRNKQN